MKRFVTAILAAVLCLVAMTGCTQTGVQAESPAPSQQSVQPTPSESVEPSPVQTEEVSPSPVPSVPEEPVPDVVVYSFGAPVEEHEPVEEAWFADAAFVGDSRTEGLQLFSGLRTGDFLWGKGMNVFKAVDRESKSVKVSGEELSILEALERKQYGKVYIMMGINELGYSTARYEEGLRELVAQVKAIQPGAVIYLQTLPPVNETVAMRSGLGSYIRNKKVNSFNEAICRVAWDMHTALLDVASVYRTEEGELAADMAVDGVHFYRQGYARWYEYLKSHTLDPAAYENGAPLAEPYVPVVPEPPVVEWISPSPEPSESTTPTPTETPAPTEPPAPPETPFPTEPPAPPETPIPGESPAPSVPMNPELPDVTDLPEPTAEIPVPTVPVVTVPSGSGDPAAPAETESPATP